MMTVMTVMTMQHKLSLWVVNPKNEMGICRRRRTQESDNTRDDNHVYTSRKHHKNVPNKQASKQEIIVPRACNQQASKQARNCTKSFYPTSKQEIVPRECSQQVFCAIGRTAIFWCLIICRSDCCGWGVDGSLEEEEKEEEEEEAEEFSQPTKDCCWEIYYYRQQRIDIF
jgi:hypothetical protein